MGKPEYPGGKPIDRMQCKAYDINLDEGFTAIKAQENKSNKRERERERERERDAHIHSYAIVHAYIRTNAVLWSATVKASEGVGGKGKTNKSNSIIKAT